MLHVVEKLHRAGYSQDPCFESALVVWGQTRDLLLSPGFRKLGADAHQGLCSCIHPLKAPFQSLHEKSSSSRQIICPRLCAQVRPGQHKHRSGRTFFNLQLSDHLAGTACCSHPLADRNLLQLLPHRFWH